MKKKFAIPDCQTCPTRLHSIFDVLDGEEVALVSMKKACSFYKRGQIIFHEGVIPNGIYIINSGKVKIFKLGIEGKEQIVRLAREGEILGYRSLLSGDRYSATAAVFEDTSICFISKETLFDLMERNHRLSRNVMELLAAELKKAEDKMTHLAQDSVRERLAQTLLILKETYGLKEDGKTLNVRLSREDIANITGTATETVIRLLSDFHKEGLIELDRKNILFNGGEGLVKVAKVVD